MIFGKCTDCTGAEKLHAQTRELIGRTKTKIYFQGTIQQRCTRILAALRTIKLDQTKVGNHTKPLKYSEKKSISYQFRADVQTYDHRPQCKADDTAD